MRRCTTTETGGREVRFDDGSPSTRDRFRWLTGIICAVEQCQSYYGAMRTGDWGAMRTVASFHARKLPYYRHFARRVYGHGGALIPMWQGVAVLSPPADAEADQPPVGYRRRRYNGENAAGRIWMLGPAV